MDPEDCFDIIDNDGDQLIDSEDPDCAPGADGGRQGLNPDGGKPASKCEKAIAKAGANFTSIKLKRLEKCMDSAFACVQRKPGDANCLDKAARKCLKQIEALTKPLKGDEDKLVAKVLKSCGPKKPGQPPQVPPADLLGLVGLGQGAPRESDRCALFGVGSLSSINDVALCLGLQHECRIEQIFSKEAPRAREMLSLLGIDPVAQFPCLEPGSNGGGGGLLDPDAAKAAAKCQKTIKKAGAKFVTGYMKNLTSCAGAVRDCVQKKGGDASCLDKAERKCQKLVTKIQLPGKGLEAKLIATILKNCGPDRLSFSHILDQEGLGYASEIAQCNSLGISSLVSAADLAECIKIQHRRRAQQLLEKEVPRIGEMLDMVGVPFPMP